MVSRSPRRTLIYRKIVNVLGKRQINSNSNSNTNPISVPVQIDRFQSMFLCCATICFQNMKKCNYYYQTLENGYTNKESKQINYSSVSVKCENFSASRSAARVLESIKAFLSVEIAVILLLLLVYFMSRHSFCLLILTDERSNRSPFSYY